MIADQRLSVRSDPMNFTVSSQLPTSEFFDDTPRMPLLGRPAATSRLDSRRRRRSFVSAFRDRSVERSRRRLKRLSSRQPAMPRKLSSSSRMYSFHSFCRARLRGYQRIQNLFRNLRLLSFPQMGKSRVSVDSFSQINQLSTRALASLSVGTFVFQFCKAICWNCDRCSVRW